MFQIAGATPCALKMTVAPIRTASSSSTKRSCSLQPCQDAAVVDDRAPNVDRLRHVPQCPFHHGNGSCDARTETTGCDQDDALDHGWLTSRAVPR